MKSIWNFLVNMADGINRARVASHLAKIGKHEEARKLIQK
jgi:hypothetical protein